ncbi:MAG: DUF3418 domain-containing protein, partial [Verrucomicrobiota bacterium]
MAGEMVETSQLFARTVAGIDPLWIVQLAPHLCKITHQNPRWVVGAGNVLADEKITLYGLEVNQRKVAYGNINPREATEIFIRSALVEEDLLPTSRRGNSAEDDDEDDVRVLRSAVTRKPALPPQYAFLEHNRQVRQKIETWQTRVRRHDLGNLDQRLFDFYAQRLTNISSVAELNRFLHDESNRNALRIAEADLTGGTEGLNYDAEAFPDAVPLGGQPVALSYAYTPGEEQDGVTVKLGFSLAQTVSPASVEWAVPGLREGQISELLRALPKALRRELMPFPPKVAEIARELQPTGDSLQDDLARFIHQRYGIQIPANAWPADAIPAHLRPRIEVMGHDKKSLGASRDLGQLRKALEKTKVESKGEDPAWTRLAQQWERFHLTGWTFGDLPERLTVSASGTVPLYAWPGLAAESGGVCVRLYHSQEAARRASIGGIQWLVTMSLQKDFAWLQKDLRTLSRYEPLLANFCSVDELAAGAFENLKRHVLPQEVFPALTEAHFRAALETTRGCLPGLATQLIDRVGLILKLRQEIQRRCGPIAKAAEPRARTLSDLKQLGNSSASRPSSPWPAELNALVPPDFLATIPFEQLPQVPRYLKALLTRMERAALNPVKDQERARQLSPYLETWRKLSATPPKSEAARRELETFRWMLEEFKV